MCKGQRDDNDDIGWHWGHSEVLSVFEVVAQQHAPTSETPRQAVRTRGCSVPNSNTKRQSVIDYLGGDDLRSRFFSSSKSRNTQLVAPSRPALGRSGLEVLEGI